METTAGPRPALAFTIGTGAGIENDVYPGEVRARREADHAFRVGGKVVQRLVDAGTRVARGQVLARLDPQDTRLSADAAEAAVSAAETEAHFALAEHKRFQDLFNKGFVSQSALDQRLNVANAAKARLESARATASVSNNQASYTTLVAEFDGVVTQALAEAGQVVAAGQAVVRIANPTDKELLIHVPETRIGEFRASGRAGGTANTARDIRVATVSEPGRYMAARVREIAAAADPVTRTYAVRLALQAAGDDVRLGMSAHAVFVGEGATDVLHVPLSAVLVHGTESGVYRIGADGTLALVPVSVVQFTETSAVIKAALNAGDVIVAAGVHKLRAGDRVKPLTDSRVTGDGKVAHVPAALQLAARAH